MMTDNELVEKAWKIYGRKPGVDCPSESLSDVESQDGKKYVVLRNGYRTLGVWRVIDDRIRRLKPCYHGYPVVWFETQRALARFIKAHTE